MARFSFLALLAVVSAGFAAAGPAQDTLQAVVGDKWRWEQCGTRLFGVLFLQPPHVQRR